MVSKIERERRKEKMTTAMKMYTLDMIDIDEYWERIAFMEKKRRNEEENKKKLLLEVW